jgi:hypothetical protein
MRRRTFLGILGCAAAWPIALSAQPADRVRVVGIFSILGPDDPEAKARTTIEQPRKGPAYPPPNKLYGSNKTIGPLFSQSADL